MFSCMSHQQSLEGAKGVPSIPQEEEVFKKGFGVSDLQEKKERNQGITGTSWDRF